MIDFTRLQVILDTQVSTYKLSYQEAARLVLTAYNVVINHPEVIVTDSYNHDFSTQEIEELRNFVVDHPDSFAEQLIMEIHAGCTLVDCEFISDELIQAVAAKFPASYTRLLTFSATQSMLDSLVEEYKQNIRDNKDVFLYTE